MPIGLGAVLGHTGSVTVGLAPAPPRPRRTRRSRRPATRVQIIAVATIATAAGIVAALTSDAAPTGTPYFDVLWRIALVVVSSIAGARARRSSLAVAAGLVVIGAAGWWSIAGLVALGLCFALAWEDRRSRIAGSAAGALTSLAALHLGWPTPTFATAILAGFALGLMWISAYRTSSRRVRRRVRLSVLAVGAFALVGTVMAVAFAATQRSNVQSAIDDAMGAADRIGGASTSASSAGFASARAHLADVVRAADAPWMFPARAVPLVGANLRSVRESAAAGADLSAVAERLSDEVDYERLHLDGGGIDLGVLGSFREPVTEAERALAHARDALVDARSPLVVGPVARRMEELTGRVRRAHSDATTARLGVERAPGLLGAAAPRRYLLLLGNPAEARDLGGHIGNWAEVVATGGRLDVVRVGSPYELFGPSGPDRPFLADPSSFPRSLREMNPTRFPQNWGATPDLPTVARLAAELYPQSDGGAPLDGVIYADTAAFAAAIGVTGPVPVAGTGLTIDSGTAAEFLERGQYALFPRESQGDEAVTELVRTALDRLLEGRLPAPEAVADAFGPSVDGGHLKFFSLHAEDHDLLERLHLDGAIGVVPGADALAVITRNANPSKVDSYLERSIDQRVTWDPDSGRIRTRVEVTLTNTAPPSGLPQVVGLAPPGAAEGTNRTELAVLTPLRSGGATVDGAAAAIGSRDDIDGLTRHTLQIDLAPGQSRKVTFDLHGRLDPGDYRLRWIAQPLVNADDARLVISSTGRPFRGGASSGSVDLTEDLTGGGRTITVRVED